MENSGGGVRLLLETFTLIQTKISEPKASIHARLIQEKKTDGFRERKISYPFQTQKVKINSQFWPIEIKTQPL